MAWRNHALIVAVFALPGAAQAQEMDWGPIMQTEAMNSAIDEAAREGSGSRQTTQSRARYRATNPKTRENCAKVRQFIADGVRDSRLPRLAATCSQFGY